MQQQYDLREGMDVVGSDGGKVGEVVAAHRNYVVVEKGFFFPTDYYIPTSAVASADDGKIYLNVTKDQALDQGWDTGPADDAGYVTTETTTAATAGAGAATRGREVHPDDVPFEHREDSEATHIDDVDHNRLSVPLHEEELAARTRQVELGEVRIGKDVVAEERTLEVPVTEERVRVSRVAVDRDATADDTAFQEGVIEVPVRGEEVELQKRVRVAEEVEVEKEAVQRTETVGGTVRREEVYVDDATVDTTGTTGTTRGTSTDIDRGTTG